LDLWGWRSRLGPVWVGLVRIASFLCEWKIFLLDCWCYN
jgi:hypothetical protein